MSDSDEQPMLEQPQQDLEHENDPDEAEDLAETIDLTETTLPENVPKNQSQKRPHPDNECLTAEVEGEMCPICLDLWADAGKHRLCALKCGHLFGRSCIEMWLKDNRNCPTCKKRALKRDIRDLFCSKVVALEESSILDLRNRLHDAEQQQALLQATVVQYAVQRDQMQQQITSLHEDLLAAKTQLQLRSAVVGATCVNTNVCLYRQLTRIKTVQLSTAVGCRVMDYDAWLNAIVCSVKCQTAMFGGYGLAKLNMSSFEVIGSMPLHNAPIRDVRFQSAGGSSLLVTVSMDRRAQIVDTRAPGFARTFAPPIGTRSAPLWACCWGDAGVFGGSYTLFLGEQQGDVLELDLRSLTERVSTMKVEGDMSPVVSLQVLPSNMGSRCLPGGALVACRLSSVRLFERQQTGAYQLRTLVDAPAGPFMSLAVDRRAAVGSRHALLSARPNAAHAYARHVYGEFREADASGSLTFSALHTFAGGLTASLLSRSCVTAQCACAYVENTGTVTTWCLATGQVLPSCHAVQQPVLDVAMFKEANGTHHMLALDDQKLHVFNME